MASLCLSLLTGCFNPPLDVSDTRSLTGGQAQADATAGKPCLNIVNGSLDPDRHPGVVLLASEEAGGYRVCSGTFVGTNAILTAAHCLSDADKGGLRILPNADYSEVSTFIAAYALAEQSTGVFVGPVFGDAFKYQEESHRKIDLAILTVPENPKYPAAVPVAVTSPPADAAVTLVGYGRTSTKDTQASDRKRRHGANKLSSVTWSSLLTVYGRQEPDATSTPSLAAKGDSGGPMLVDDSVVGVFSTYGHTSDMPDGFGVNLYVDVNSTESRQLIDKALAGGAKITFKGDREAVKTGTDGSTGNSTVAASGTGDGTSGADHNNKPGPDSKESAPTADTSGNQEKSRANDPCQ